MAQILFSLQTFVWGPRRQCAVGRAWGCPRPFRVWLHEPLLKARARGGPCRRSSPPPPTVPLKVTHSCARCSFALCPIRLRDPHAAGRVVVVAGCEITLLLRGKVTRGCVQQQSPKPSVAVAKAVGGSRRWSMRRLGAFPKIKRGASGRGHARPPPPPRRSCCRRCGSRGCVVAVNPQFDGGPPELGLTQSSETVRDAPCAASVWRCAPSYEGRALTPCHRFCATPSPSRPPPARTPRGVHAPRARRAHAGHCLHRPHRPPAARHRRECGRSVAEGRRVAGHNGHVLGLRPVPADLRQRVPDPPPVADAHVVRDRDASRVDAAKHPVGQWGREF